MPYFHGDSLRRVQPAGRINPSASNRSRRRGFENNQVRDTELTRTFYEDIQHWAASSARGSMSAPDFPSLSMSGDPSFSSSVPMFQSKSEGTCSMASTYPDLMYNPDSPLFAPGTALTQTGSFPNEFGPDAPMMEFSTSSGTTTGSSNEFMGCDGSFATDATSPHFWLDSSSEGEVPYLDMYGVAPGPWSPSTGSTDLSLPSAPSSGPLLPTGFVGSPTCFGTGNFSPKIVPDDALLTQFTLGASALSSGGYDFDLSSPSTTKEETYLPGSQAPMGFPGAAYDLPPRAKAFFSNRLSSDGENIKARQHDFYNVGPGPDGLYHCPYANDQDGCRRKPDKLKCNYDKHMDSHLKPYRCQDPACADVPFSSTACLLRHEREAHGLHGHGDRPYSCHFEDCERAVLGNGFPRRWNLQDHMRRVHNYTEPEAESVANAEIIRPRRKKSSAPSAPSSRRNSRPVLYRSRV